VLLETKKKPSNLCITNIHTSHQNRITRSVLRNKSLLFTFAEQLTILLTDRQTIMTTTTTNETFPEILHRMILFCEHNNLSAIISFAPHGRSFTVHNACRLENELLPKFFISMSKLASFQRQLNLYGFKRIMEGPDIGGYWHRKFLRGRFDVVTTLKRKSTNRARRLQQEKDEAEEEKRDKINPLSFYNMQAISPRLEDGDNGIGRLMESHGLPKRSPMEQYAFLREMAQKEQQIQQMMCQIQKQQTLLNTQNNLLNLLRSNMMGVNGAGTLVPTNSSPMFAPNEQAVMALLPNQAQAAAAAILNLQQQIQLQQQQLKSDTALSQNRALSTTANMNLHQQQLQATQLKSDAALLQRQLMAQSQANFTPFAPSNPMQGLFNAKQSEKVIDQHLPVHGNFL